MNNFEQTVSTPVSEWLKLCLAYRLKLIVRQAYKIEYQSLSQHSKPFVSCFVGLTLSCKSELGETCTRHSPQTKQNCEPIASMCWRLAFLLAGASAQQCPDLKYDKARFR